MMRIKEIAALAAVVGLSLAATFELPAQAQGRGGGNKQAPATGAPAPFVAYPQRPAADPLKAARGKEIYSVNCAFCHGEDARGGDVGPNIIRDQVLLNDKDGELLAPVLDAGRPAQGMPNFKFTAAQTSDLAAFIHTFRVGGYDITRNRPATIVVGDAKAGEAYFKSNCAKCHSATGDLKGIASRNTDPRSLQQRWLMPTAGGRGGAVPAAPTTVTVTLANGQKVEGRLGRIDDFTVTLIAADGTSQTIRRDGDTPKVEVHDPIQGHRDLLPKYTDKNIHDVTAYLVTVK
jgi:cytochrome c oxidase cbb3-type subunit III